MNESPQIIAGRTQQAMQEGRFKDALVDLETLKRVMVGDGSIYLMTAQAYRHLEDWEQARLEFKSAIKLTPNDLSYRALYAEFLLQIEDFESAVTVYDEILCLVPNHPDAMVDRILALAKTEKRSDAVKQLRNIAEQHPDNFRYWNNLAILLREDMDYKGAETAINYVLAKDPQNQKALQIRAQCAFDKGERSSRYFEEARQVNPENLSLAASQAGALVQEEKVDEAVSLLENQLEKTPVWFEGHRALAEIKWQMSGDENFAESYQKALASNPEATPLWSDYIIATSKALGHESALQLTEVAMKANDQTSHFEKLKAISLTELGELEAAEKLFNKTGYKEDHRHHLAYLRFLVIAKRYDEAARVGLELVERGNGSEAWPYIGISWRKLEDERWQWFEGQPELIRTIDLPDIEQDLPALTQYLRNLHGFQKQPFAQSLRGGTQTDGELFRRQQPEIQSLFNKIQSAVRQYVDGLPPVDAKHPLLSRKRDIINFVGSWSVRLMSNGFHVNHIHNMGTISSAFYVSLPDSISSSEDESEERKRDGWLALGQPAEELDTGLEPIRLVEPKEGRLALFPSTMWHGTLPFDGGERLTCAFDVKLG